MNKQPFPSFPVVPSISPVRWNWAQAVAKLEFTEPERLAAVPGLRLRCRVTWDAIRVGGA